MRRVARRRREARKDVGRVKVGGEGIVEEQAARVTRKRAKCEGESAGLRRVTI